jgi:RNA polymerase sigma-70 factor (ECF subfamily)
MIVALGSPSSHSSATEKIESVPNAELVRRLQADPASAAPLLYQRYEPRVRWIVRRMLGPDPDHYDVVQQVFYDLLKSGFDLREPEKLPAWIRSVTVCAVYEELRRRRLRRNLEASFVDRLARDFVREVEARDLLARAVAMIEHLPQHERAAFVLRMVEGRTYGEVAKLIGCSTATIKRRLARANRRMLSMLARNTELMKLARGPAAAQSADRIAESSAPPPSGPPN